MGGLTNADIDIAAAGLDGKAAVVTATTGFGSSGIDTGGSGSSTTGVFSITTGVGSVMGATTGGAGGGGGSSRGGTIWKFRFVCLIPNLGPVKYGIVD